MTRSSLFSNMLIPSCNESVLNNTPVYGGQIDLSQLKRQMGIFEVFLAMSPLCYRQEIFKIELADIS
jgi:hypothetical protein